MAHDKGRQQQRHGASPDRVSRDPFDLQAWAAQIKRLVQQGQWAAAIAVGEGLPDRFAAQGAGVLLALANALYDAKRPTDAAALYAKAQDYSRGNPSQTLEAVYNRACCLRDLRQIAAALDAFRQAQRIDPMLVQVYGEIAAAARPAAQHQLADSALRHGLLLDPAHRGFLRGMAAAEPGQETVWKRRAAICDPMGADLFTALAVQDQQYGGDARALTYLRQALALHPASAEALSNLMLLPHQAVDAVRTAARACRLAPDRLTVWINYSAVAKAAGAIAVAEACCRRALALQPTATDGWGNLAGLAVGQGRWEAALAAAARGLLVAGGEREAAGLHVNRGVALMSTGQNSAAIASFRQALAGRPDDPAIRSNMLFCLCFDPDTPPEIVYTRHRAFEHSLPRRPKVAPVAAAPAAADGRMRIGYVSPDFQRYPGPGFHFLLPLLSHHDVNRFAVTAYYTDTKHDAVTARFQSTVERWRDAAGWSDAQLAAQVAADGIDILVDCDGHMSRNRMTAFARRMAPVQVSFPLYPNTTGLSAMDYQFGDPWLTPEWMQDYRCEALIRLPHTVLCYRPAEDSTFIPPETAPWERNGSFTFASFNNLAKLDPETLAVWSRILHAAPNSRLMLKWRGLVDGVAARVCETFAGYGIDSTRLVLRGPTTDPYEGYGEVDLCLDPVFAAGGTTTCDALWAGTPILTLPGRTVIGRWGLSLLLSVGLRDFIASTVDDYVSRAVAWAEQPQKLSDARRGLRARVAASPLMDEVGYTRSIETAYAGIWAHHQAGLPPEPFSVERL